MVGAQERWVPENRACQGGKFASLGQGLGGGGGGRDPSELESSVNRDEKNALVHYFCLDTVTSLMAPV